MTVEFMFFVKPWYNNKFNNKSVMPIPNNLFLKIPNVLYLYICYLIDMIDKLDNQYKHDTLLRYKWHKLTLWKLF